MSELEIRKRLEKLNYKRKTPFKAAPMTNTEQRQLLVEFIRVHCPKHLLFFREKVDDRWRCVAPEKLEKAITSFLSQRKGESNE